MKNLQIEEEPKHKKQKQDDQWIGDNLSENKRKRIKQLMGITDEQMSEAMQKAKDEWNQQLGGNQNSNRSFYSDYGTADDADSFSLSQQVNWAVYTILFVSLLYFINRDYDDIVKIFFIRYFPKEANTIGLV